jgi:tetratricopeptide (TPR) repeat protein
MGDLCSQPTFNEQTENIKAQLAAFSTEEHLPYLRGRVEQKWACETSELLAYLTLIGHLLKESGQYLEAIPYLERARGLSIAFREVLNELRVMKCMGDCWTKLGENDEAIKLLSTILEYGNDPSQ